MGTNLSVIDPMGRTPLYQAAKEGSVVILKLLLEKGADVTVVNNGGWTPLNSAASSGHIEVVKQH
jgi:ankyrin repeat protein